MAQGVSKILFVASFLAEDDRQKALCAFLVSRQSSWLNATFDKWKSACSHRQELSRVTTAIQVARLHVLERV